MRTPNRTYQMLLFFVVLTAALIPLYALPVRSVSAKLVTLSRANALLYNGTEYRDVVPNALDEKGIAGISKGDVLEFTYTLPDIPFDYPSLMIKTSGASLTVYIGEKPLFSHDHVDGHTGHFEDWGTHFVELPPSWRGKELTVRLDVQVPFAFRGVYPPILGSYPDLMHYLAYLGILPLLVAMFMCTYGILYIAISLVFALRFKEMSGQIYAAALCLISGIWLISYHEFFLFVSKDAHTPLLESCMMFIAVPVYYLYLRHMDLPLKSRAHRIVAVVLSSASILFLLMALIFGIRLHLSLPLFAVIVLCGFVLVVRFFIEALRSPDTDPSEIIQMSGLTLLLLCIILHVILYYAEDYQGITRGVVGRNVMGFGVSLFLESQLINYFVFVARRFAERMERSELEEMAYRDFLTKLPNRTDAERVFQQMVKSSQDFCVVMFDLNDLKDVNDKNGHDAGDHLLVEFAQVLRVSFDEGSYLARIGGDEFVAVIEGVSANSIERHLRTLTDALHRLDIIEPHIAHSVSYGYAFRHECAENESPPARTARQMIHGPADFSDVNYNFTVNRRRFGDKKEQVQEENVLSSESKYAKGDDILQRTMSLADKRMYEKKRLWKTQHEGGASV